MSINISKVSLPIILLTFNANILYSNKREACNAYENSHSMAEIHHSIYIIYINIYLCCTKD